MLVFMYEKEFRGADRSDKINQSEGKLEYHLPATFDEYRPSFLYSFEHFESSIADHPVGSRLPRGGSDRPAIFDGGDKFNSLLGDPRMPRDYREWANSDTPQLGLRIVTFKDATCVTITFLHCLTDAIGFGAILRAWLAILHEKEEEVPPFFGFDTDPMLAIFEKSQPPRFVLADRILRGFPLFLFGVRTKFQSFWYGSEERVIFFPAEKVQQMRQDALAELASQDPDANDKPFISENDLLSAWLARALTRIERSASNRTLSIMNAFDCRGVLAQMGLIPSPHVALITNCVNSCWTVLTTRQALEEPLGLLAMRVRKSLEEQRTPEQVEASLAESKSALARTGYPILVGDSDMKMIMLASWGRGSLFALDFSPAVIKVGTSLDKRHNQPGRPSYISVMDITNFAVPSMGSAIGKDAKGNLWFRFRLRRDQWTQIEKQLKEL